jgi:D-alanine-D-alanine ligase
MTRPNTMDGLRVGVLCGGTSPERAGSLASGDAAAKALAELGYSTTLLDTADTTPQQVRDCVDVAVLATHGLGGEDGKLQGALDTFGVPYAGSGVLASAIGMHKPTFKKLIGQSNLDTPRSVVVRRNWTVAMALDAVNIGLGFPVFVKPSSGGGSLEAAVCQDEIELQAFLEMTRGYSYAEYMVEEFIDGTPCTVGVLEVNGKLRVLPVLSVETNREFYDYTAKHDPTQRTESCPSALPDAVTGRMQQYALRAHFLLGAHGYSRADFMVTPSGRVPLLEVNTLPGLSALGNMATMARAADIEYPELLRHILATAYSKPTYLP